MRAPKDFRQIRKATLNDLLSRYGRKYGSAAMKQYRTRLRGVELDIRQELKGIDLEIKALAKAHFLPGHTWDSKHNAELMYAKMRRRGSVRAQLFNVIRLQGREPTNKAGGKPPY